MAKYVLVSDTTLAYDYRNFPLLDFLPCAPSEIVPGPVYTYLRGHSRPPIQGRASVAPYSIRKIEAALLQENGPSEVLVPHQDHLEDFIKSDTEVIGVSTMDPLGLGPLTMSLAVLLGPGYTPFVRREFEALISQLNRARKGTKAKLVIGGPGVWELTVLPEELSRLNIDYAFQGELDDIACEFFRQVSSSSISNSMFFEGFQTFDDTFHKNWSDHERFITRRRFSKQFPSIDEIPEIRNPSMKGMVEMMRGCGIGCDFCEVTLRPLRYYPYEKIRKEIMVNVRGGYRNAWLHTDEVFAYEHGRNFEPNPEALKELFKAVMSTKGIVHTNPTHGRISIPAAYPELIRSLSLIMKAGPSRWIGVQVGLETGSERLAKLHMPNKTLPLHIGADGTWQDIVWQGVYNFNRYYWRPAFTVQVGQIGETQEDNWETVALINRLSNSEIDGRPFEFSVTPMQNVSLGLLKNRKLSVEMLGESQLAVYYASYRHLAKMATRGAYRDSRGNILSKAVTAAIINLGGRGMLHIVETICKRRGLDLTKVERYGLERSAPLIAA